MRDLIRKVKNRYEEMPDSDAKNLMLQTILPLFEHHIRKNDESFADIDANFDDVFAHLNIVNERDFLELSQELIGGLGGLVNALLLGSKFLVEDDEGGLVRTPETPDIISEMLDVVGRQNAEWTAQYTALRAAEEEARLAAEDDDDDDPRNTDQELDPDASDSDALDSGALEADAVLPSEVVDSSVDQEGDHAQQ